MEATIKDTRKVPRDSFISISTYKEVKAEIRKLAESKGSNMSKYLESLALEDLRKKGISITVKRETKIIL
jgi:hypothetical protein